MPRDWGPLCESVTRLCSRTMIRFAEGVWLDTATVRFLGLQLTANMTVRRLGDGGLLLHSPIALTPERKAAVDALGPAVLSETGVRSRCEPAPRFLTLVLSRGRHHENDVDC